MKRIKRYCKEHPELAAAFVMIGVTSVITGGCIAKMQNQKIAGVYMLDIEDGSKLVSLLRRDNKVAKFHFPVES